MNRPFSLCSRLLISAFILGLPTTVLPKAKKETSAQTTKSTKKKKKKTLSEMDLEELTAAKNERLAKKDKEGAIRYLEKMVTTCKDKDDLAIVLIELADLFFDTGKLVQAEKFYSQFYTLYPGNDNIEKAHYKAILCSFYLTLDNDRDQSKTQETLTLANSFLDRKEIFTKYAQDVSSIQLQCNEKLCQSDLSVTEFYLKRGKEKDLVAAQQRLENIRKEYSDKVPSLEPRILALEIDHAVKTKDFTLAEQKRTILANRFPESKATQLASRDAKKSSFVDRF